MHRSGTRTGVSSPAAPRRYSASDWVALGGRLDCRLPKRPRSPARPTPLPTPASNTRQAHRSPRQPSCLRGTPVRVSPSSYTPKDSFPPTSRYQPFRQPTDSLHLFAVLFSSPDTAIWPMQSRPKCEWNTVPHSSDADRFLEGRSKFNSNNGHYGTLE